MERIKKAKNIKNIGKILKYKKVLNLGKVFQRKNLIKHIPIAGLILTIAIVFFMFRMDILSYTDPTVETHDATDILTTQVKGNGEIISTGGQDIDEIGFEYGLSQEPTWVKNETAGGYGVGPFDLTIDGLTANTEYWYRAYAKRIARKMYALIVTSPNELQLFDMDGNLVNQIAVAGWSYAGCGVTLDSGGNIYIEENMEVIKKYDSNLNLLVTQNIESGDNWIEGINMGQDGYLYTLEGIASGYDIKKRNVSDLTIQEVIPITSDIWNFHTGTPCLDSDGNFYMVGDNDDIVKYSSTGVLLASIDVGSISNEYAGCGVLGNYVYFVKSTNKIVYLPLDLSTYTDWDLPSGIAYGITVADEHLILSGWDGDNDGATSKYDSDRNLVWTKKLTDAGYAYKAGGYPSPTEYIAYGEWLDFTTAAGLTVETHDATDILTTQVKGNGEIISTGGQDIDEIGFEYGLSQEPTWVKNETAGGYGVGPFDLTIDGLTANTEYWYRAYAKYISGFTAIKKTTSAFDKTYSQFQIVGNKIYYTWTEYDALGDGQIWTAVSELDGGNFVATKRTTTAYNSDLSQLQVVDSKIYFVYSEYDDNYNEQIWTAIMDLDGSNWSATKRTTSNYSKMSPHMQVVGTKIYYAWYENNDSGNYQIWIASMDLDGSNWSATKKTDTAYDNLDISFQVIDTKIYYAWCGLQADHHRIFTAISDLDGGNWEATERVDTAGFTYTKGIVLQVVDTKIYYAWIQRVVANYKDQIWTAVMNIDGTNWVATQKTTSDYHKASVQLEVVGDKIYYAWEETDGSDYQIWTATMDTDSTDWLAIKRTTSAYDKEFPQLQIVSGIIYYLWDEYDDLGNSQIWITIWNISGNFAYGEWVKFISEVPSHGGGRMLMSPQAPAGGFRILINDGAEYPDSPIVNLKLFGGPDTARMAISNFSDFRDAEQENYTLTKIWDLCKGFVSCPEGEYTVYAKFYAPWGMASEVVSDSITYKKPEEEPEEEVSKEEQSEEKKAEEEILEEEELEEIPGIFPEGEEVSEKVLPEKEMPKRKTLQERVTTLILGIISETIKRLKELRENEAIIKVNYQIITPVLVPIALILNTTNFVLTSIPLLLPNFRFILAQLFGLLIGLFKRKRKPWGVVFSTFNQKPLRGVIVRIYEKQTNKLIETQITDIQGRFGFLVGPGQYYIKAQKPGYIFPTAKKEFIFDGQQITPYKEEVIDIKEEKGEKGEGLINVFIPLDPDRFLISAKRLALFKLFNKIQPSLEKANPYIFVSGFSFSGFALFVTPGTYNKIIFLIYFFLLGVNIITSFNLKKQYGIIKDSGTKLPLSSAVIRLFNAEYGQLAQERITDQNGRYRFLISPGTYYLIILKEGYQIFQSELLTVKPEKAIEKDFKLEKTT